MKQLFILIISISFLLLGCNKEEAKLPDQDAEKATYLVFESVEDYTTLLAQLQKSSDEFAFVNTRFPNFQSYAALFDSFNWDELEKSGVISSIDDYKNYPVFLLQDGEEYSVEPIVDANLLSYIVDEIRCSHGVVVIDNGGVIETTQAGGRVRFNKSDCKITIHWSALWITGVNIVSGSSTHLSRDAGVSPNPNCSLVL